MTSNDNAPQSSLPRWLDASAIAFAALLPTAVTAVYFVALWDFPTWVQQLAWAICKPVQFAFPLLWVLAVQRRRPRVGPQWWHGLGAGVGFGAVVFAGMLVLYHLWLKPAGVFVGPAAAMQQKLGGMGLETLGRYAAFAFFVSVIHSALEEYYFRWFVFGQMRHFLPVNVSILLSSLSFAAHHVLVLAMYFGLDVVVHPLDRRWRRLLGLALRAHRIALRPLDEPLAGRRRHFRHRLRAGVLR